MRLQIFLLFLGVILYGCQAQGDLIAGMQAVTLTETLGYYLYYPAEYEEDPEKEFGLLLFLHGGGEAGGQLG
ncbi:MAG: alpha/beta hydrolase, partial [Bacteroidota bacterium]